VRDLSLAVRNPEFGAPAIDAPSKEDHPIRPFSKLGGKGSEQHYSHPSQAANASPGESIAELIRTKRE
jgi:hypothetical protein